LLVLSMPGVVLFRFAGM